MGTALSEARRAARPAAIECGAPLSASGAAAARQRWRPPPLSAPAGVAAPGADSACAHSAGQDSGEATQGRPEGAGEDPREDLRQNIYEEIREAAYRAGFDQGCAEGRAAGRAEAQALAGRMQGLLQALAAPFAQTDAELMRELLALTERVCRALLARELRTDSEAIARVLAAALDALGESHTAVELTLNPADAGLCRELGLVTEGAGEFTLREDAEVQRGGVLLRRGSERIDARIETRLRAIIESLYAQADLPEPARTPDEPRESA